MATAERDGLDCALVPRGQGDDLVAVLGIPGRRAFGVGQNRGGAHGQEQEVVGLEAHSQQAGDRIAIARPDELAVVVVIDELEAGAVAGQIGSHVVTGGIEGIDPNERPHAAHHQNSALDAFVADPVVH